MNFAKNKQALQNAILETEGNDLNLEGKEWTILKKLKKHPFFKLINILLQRDQTGRSLGLGLPVIASITDTRTADRVPLKVYSPDDDGKYLCEQVNFDSVVPYARLDTLSGLIDVDFNKVIAEETDRAVLLSLFAMGFNGKGRTPTGNSQPQKYALAQDVKKGWLQKIREQDTPKTLNRPAVGAGQQFANLNKLIAHALQKLPEQYRANRNDLIAICGANVIADYPVDFTYNALADSTTGKIVQVKQLIGGLNAVGLPYFPENSVLILPLRNLSIYFQNGTFRRTLYREPNEDNTKIFFSMNLDFVIEDYQAAVLIDDIQFNEGE